jgi:polyisoprenoid-binding protein YceI
MPTRTGPHQQREGKTHRIKGGNAMRKDLIASIVALTLAVAAARAEPAALPAGTYKMDHAHSSLTWKVNHFGLSNYTARFSRFDAMLDIDPSTPESAKVLVTVDPTSIRTDYRSAEGRDFDKELGDGEKFFNAKKFTQIIFSSTRVERTGETTARVTGDLTMLGVTKPLTIEVTLNGAKRHPTAGLPALGFSGIAKLKRSDFNMTFMLPLVGDEVTLLIEAEFLKSESARLHHAR